MGASMGGMIAQTFAIEHPTRTASLISVMSTPGEPESGSRRPRWPRCCWRRRRTERAAYIEQALASKVWRSKKYCTDDLLRQEAATVVRPLVLPRGRTAPARRHLRQRPAHRRPVGARCADARHPRSRRHAASHPAAACAPPSWCPGHTCCWWPTWATTCPSRSGRCSSTPSWVIPAAPERRFPAAAALPRDR